MNGNPLVSIFLPYYNDKKFLKTSIESVLNNDYQNFELILLNHATTDNCRKIAHSYKDKRIIHIDMKKNLGAGSGILFEKMLKASSGKYIKTFCADDVLRKDGVVKLVDFMESNPNIDFAFGNVEYIDEEGKDLHDNFFSNRDGFSLNNNEADCLRIFTITKSFLPYTGAIIKRNELTKIKINKTYVMLFDVTLWVSLLSHGCKIGYLNDIVANYRIHENQISAIGKEGKVGHFCWFEFKTFYKYFLEISDIHLAKEIWKKSRFVDKLKSKEDIPFFVAHNMFIERRHFDEAYAQLDYLLNDEKESERIEKVFNYTVKELREDLMSLYVTPVQKELKTFKEKTYNTSPKQLHIENLTYLLARRIYNILTFRDLKDKIKEKKKYSL